MAELKPCQICREDEPHTGTCGSSDPRALCNRRATDGQRAGVPEGYVLLPIEPELEQLEAIKAAYRSARRGGIGGQSMEATFHREWAPELQAYAAMLGAAPTPPAGDARQERSEMPGAMIRAEISLILSDPDSDLSDGAVRALRCIDAAIAASKGEKG